MHEGPKYYQWTRSWLDRLDLAESFYTNDGRVWDLTKGEYVARDLDPRNVTLAQLRKGDALYLNDGSYGCLFDAAHAKWPFPMRVWRETGEVGGDMAPFRLFGPTCDSMDSMPGPYDLPADIREGDVIEIGMLGAYGTAMATRFNGFGDVETAAVRDFPWQSLYDGKRKQQHVQHSASVLAFPRAKRRKQRMRRR